MLAIRAFSWSRTHVCPLAAVGLSQPPWRSLFLVRRLAVGDERRVLADPVLRATLAPSKCVTKRETWPGAYCGLSRRIISRRHADRARAASTASGCTRRVILGSHPRPVERKGAVLDLLVSLGVVGALEQ